MDLLGEAVHTVCTDRDPSFRRINYEVHANQDAILHAHLWPRCAWEPDQQRTRPVSPYPPGVWADPNSHLGSHHGELRNQLTLEILRLAQEYGRTTKT